MLVRKREGEREKPQQVDIKQLQETGMDVVK